MKFHKTTFDGAALIEPTRHGDARGWFARVFCADEFAAQGLEAQFVQANHSHSARRGTLRGMHFQRPPHAEVKLVRVLRGSLWDAIIDLRDGSPTYAQWQGFELSDRNGHMLYVPAGFAHGFQTLEDDTDVTYMVSHPYTPAAEGGVRWDDPAIGIDWPLPVSVISDKDTAWPSLTPDRMLRL
jgi:dTDP-4-dehydrorhamnose 3,5-epimerase